MPIVLFKGPAQVQIDPDGVNIVVSRDQQLNELTITPILDTTPLNSQGSSQPLAYIQTGTGIQFDLSVADMDLKLTLLALAMNTTVVGSGAAKKVEQKDLAGVKVQGKKVLIKPYDGLLPSADANSWITIPSAQISALDGTTLTYGLTTQQEIRLRFMGMPDVTGIKAIYGDTTAV